MGAPGVVPVAIITGLLSINSPFDLNTGAWNTPHGISQMPIVVDLYTIARGEKVEGYDSRRRRYIKAPPDPELAEQLATYIAGHFGEFIRSGEFTRHAGVARLSDKERARLRAAVEAHPEISIEKLAAADSAVNDRVERRRAELRRQQQRNKGMIGPSMFLVFITLVAVVELFSVVAFATTASLRLFGLAVVNGAGDPASRLRMVWRTTLVWAPALCAAAVGLKLSAERSSGPVLQVLVALMVMSGVIFVGGLIWTVMRPQRGPHDLLSGTHVVVR